MKSFDDMISFQCRLRLINDVNQWSSHTGGDVTGTWIKDKRLYVYAPNICCRDGTQARVVAGIVWKSGAQAILHWKLSPFCPFCMKHEYILAEWKQHQFTRRMACPHNKTFSAKTGMSQMENFRCNLSPLHVPAACPLVCADLGGPLK